MGCLGFKIIMTLKKLVKLEPNVCAWEFGVEFQGLW